MAKGYAGRGTRVGAFRSGLEDKVSKQLEGKNIKFDYERWRVPYVNVVNEHGEAWQERKDRMKKRHKTQRGNAEKRNWKEAL